MTNIVLASASPRRKELLGKLGLAFSVIPAEGEEVLTTSVPEEAVKELSFQKAHEVAERIMKNREAVPAPETEQDRLIVIGADTVVSIDHEIMGKPADREDAARMLHRLSGREHQVYTGVTILVFDGGRAADHQPPKPVTDICFACRTDVFVYPLSDKEIDSYIATGEPMDKAGAYGIQGAFGLYVEKIDGDYNNVVGLPVSKLWQELRHWV